MERSARVEWMEQPEGSPAGVGTRSRRRDRFGARARKPALFGAGVAAAFVAIAIYGVVVPGPQPLTAQDVQQGVQQALASMTPPPARSQLIYQAIQPSLVLVQTGDGPAAASQGPAASPRPGASPAPAASSAPAASPPENRSLGTGVVVNQQGDILTSLHVVTGAASIEVTFADGTTSPAHVGTSEPQNDIAVLVADRLPAKVVPAILGNPHAVQVGSDAYVVGNPFGLYGSISAGVVSGLDRTAQAREGGPVLHGLIQVDAAVNPGNSGGPLLNRDGQVVGIVAALLNPTKEDVFVGIGFAVPIDVAGGPAGLPPY